MKQEYENKLTVTIETRGDTNNPEGDIALCVCTCACVYMCAWVK